MGIVEFFKSRKVLSNEAQTLINMLDQGLISMIDLQKGCPVVSWGSNDSECFRLCVSSKDWTLHSVGSTKEISEGLLSRDEKKDVIPPEVLAFQWSNRSLLEVARALQHSEVYATVVRGFGWKGKISEDFSGYHTIVIYRR